MDWPLTLALAVLFAVAGAFCGWRGARRWDPMRGPRMTPWRPLMVAFAVATLLMLIHLAALGGMAR